MTLFIDNLRKCQMVDMVWYVIVCFVRELRQFCPMRRKRSSQRSAVSRVRILVRSEVRMRRPSAIQLYGLAADFKIAGEFRLLHFGMEVGGVAEAGYVLGGYAHLAERYVHEVVDCYVAVALVGE